MLIYARIPTTAPSDHDSLMDIDPPNSSDPSVIDRGKSFTVPVPPVGALDVVRSLNAEYDKACDAFSER